MADDRPTLPVPNAVKDALRDRQRLMDSTTYLERIDSPRYRGTYRGFNMQSFVPVKGQRGKFHDAVVTGIMPPEQYRDWKDPSVVEDSTGQRPLFIQEYQQPPIITEAWSHSNPASRATIPIMLARFDQERRKRGMPPVEATTDLSVHSSRLAKKGVESGLIAPEGAFKRSRYGPDEFDEDDEIPDYNPTNEFDFVDEAHERDYEDIRHAQQFNRLTPLHAAEVSGAKEHLRSMLGRRPPKPKNLGAQFEQLALDVPKVPLKFVGDD